MFIVTMIVCIPVEFRIYGLNHQIEGSLLKRLKWQGCRLCIFIVSAPVTRLNTVSLKPRQKKNLLRAPIVFKRPVKRRLRDVAKIKWNWRYFMD